MKKCLVFAVIIMAWMIVIPTKAQVRFGVKGGVNVTKISCNEGVMHASNRAGFFIGPMAEVKIPLLGLGADCALLYSQRTGTETSLILDNATCRGGGYMQEPPLTQSGIEIPVHLKKSFGLGSLLGIYLAAGPDFFFNFKDLKHAFVNSNAAQVAIDLGAGVNLLKHFQVGVNYQMPLSNAFKYGSTGGMKTKGWQVSAAYLF